MDVQLLVPDSSNGTELILSTVSGNFTNFFNWSHTGNVTSTITEAHVDVVILVGSLAAFTFITVAIGTLACTIYRKPLHESIKRKNKAKENSNHSSNVLDDGFTEVNIINQNYTESKRSLFDHPINVSDTTNNRNKLYPDLVTTAKSDHGFYSSKTGQNTNSDIRIPFKTGLKRGSVFDLFGISTEQFMEMAKTYNGTRCIEGSDYGTLYSRSLTARHPHQPRTSHNPHYSLHRHTSRENQSKTSTLNITNLPDTNPIENVYRFLGTQDTTDRERDLQAQIQKYGDIPFITKDWNTQQSLADRHLTGNLNYHICSDTSNQYTDALFSGSPTKSHTATKFYDNKTNPVYESEFSDDNNSDYYQQLSNFVNNQSKSLDNLNTSKVPKSINTSESNTSRSITREAPYNAQGITGCNNYDLALANDDNNNICKPYFSEYISGNAYKSSPSNFDSTEISSSNNYYNNYYGNKLNLHQDLDESILSSNTDKGWLFYRNKPETNSKNITKHSVVQPTKNRDKISKSRRILRNGETGSILYRSKVHRSQLPIEYPHNNHANQSDNSHPTHAQPRYLQNYKLPTNTSGVDHPDKPSKKPRKTKATKRQLNNDLQPDSLSFRPYIITETAKGDNHFKMSLHRKESFKEDLYYSYV